MALVDFNYQFNSNPITLRKEGGWLYDDNRNYEVSDVRVTKVKTMNGWLVQAFMTINGKDVVVAEDTYDNDLVDEGEDIAETFAAVVVETLRNVLSP